MEKLFYIYGWLFVRPRRRLFRNMICASSIRWLPRYEKYLEFWLWPNVPWYVLYKTVFRFFKWLYWDGWRPFCKWGDGHRQTYPLIARIVHKIGQTTAGFEICGYECFHCGSDRGCQVELSEDETGGLFTLLRTYSVGTQEGTDHRFEGITHCPVCGFSDEYEAGSL